MERLTERYIPNDEKNGISGIKVFESDDKVPLVEVLSGEYLYPAIEKLATYEDLEEQGLLVRLPCKVGDIVYDSFFGYPEPHMVKAISYGYCIGYVEPKIENEIIFYCENYTNTMKVIFSMKEFGKTIFLTREEAEKKLEEVKKNDRK